MKQKTFDFFKKHKTWILNIVYPMLAFGIIIALWAIVAVAQNRPIIWPQVDAIWDSFWKLAGQKSFYAATAATLLRSLDSFFISFAIAVLLAVFGTVFKPLHKVLSPIITVLRAAPTMAIILLAILWLDYQQAPVLIGFLISFPLLYGAIYSALSGVDKGLLEMAKVFKVRKLDTVTGIYLPSIVPSVLDSARSTISLNVKVVIAAEVMALTRVSMGVEMSKSNMIFDIPMLLAWTVAAIILSFVLELVVLGIKQLYLSRRVRLRGFKQEDLDNFKATSQNRQALGFADAEVSNDVLAEESSQNKGKQHEEPKGAMHGEPSQDIVLTDISKSYGATEVFKDFSLRIAAGEITCVLGASGSGKTTLLNVIAGLFEYKGENSQAGSDVSYIFQEHRLVPGLSIFKNLDLALRGAVKDKAQRAEIIFDALEKVELIDSAAKLPGELSGGQRQRAAMARAFVYPAPILLMDEPFKALDIALKDRLIKAFLKLYGQSKKTVVFVTHDIFEAINLSDTVLVLEGRPAQIGLRETMSKDKQLRDAFGEDLTDVKTALYNKLKESGANDMEY